MPKYNLNKLGSEEFESLSQALVQKVIGPGAKVYGMGKDGSREATFEGEASYPSKSERWNGKWIFQAKFHDIVQIGMEKAREAIKRDIDDELNKIINKYKYTCDNYILITNVSLSPVHQTGTKDRIENDILPKFKKHIPHIHVWGAEEVKRFLDQFPAIRRTYSDLIIPADVITKLLDNLEKPQELTGIRENKLISRLLKLDDIAAENYKGAKLTFKNEKHVNRISQSANSLIYICKILSKFKDRIIKNTEVLPKPAFERISSLFNRLRELCEYYSKLSRQDITTNDLKFEENLNEFEYVVYEILKPNKEILQELDELLEIEAPKQHHIEKLLQLLNHPTHSQYFFTRLSSSKWFDLLEERNFFSEPEAESIEGFLLISLWPPVNYLIKISPLIPEKVFKIIKNLEGTKNYRIYRPLFECLYNMPVNISKKALSIIEKWIKHYASIQEYVVLKKIVNKFILEGELDLAYNLIKILFNTEEPTIKVENRNVDYKFHFLFSDFEDFITNIIKIEVENSLNRFIRIICSSLDIKLSSEFHYEIETYKDKSERWRRSLDSVSRLHTIKDTKNSLINLILHYYEKLAEESNELFISNFTVLSEFKWTMFRRIEIYLVNLYPKQLKSNLNVILTNKKFFEDKIYWTEYHELLSNHFLAISKQERNLIFNWLRDGPDSSKYPYNLEDFSNETEFQKWEQRFRSNWLRSTLEPLKTHLPLDLKEIYNEIIVSTEKPKPYEKERLIQQPRFISGSPLTIEQIEKLSIPQLIIYLNDWNPPDDEFFTSKDSLGIFMSKVITKNPLKYKQLIKNFQDIRIIYIPYLIEGYSHAIKNGIDFNIPEIIQLIIEIFNKNKYDAVDSSKLDIWKEIITFFREVFRLDDLTLKVKDINKVWEIISYFFEIVVPELDSFDIRDSGYQDYVNFSISTFRGSVIRIFLDYALFCAKLFTLPENDRMAPEVKEKLDDLLDPNKDIAIIDYSIISYRLYDIFYLNKNWATSKIPIIFPLDNKEMRKITWECYISYNNLNGYIYNHMYDQYINAINDMSRTIYTERALENLAYHIVLLFVNAIEDLEEGSIIRLFFSNATTELRSRAMWYTIKVFDHASKLEKKDEIIERIIELWKFRIRIAKSDGKLTTKEKSKEFQWYGFLFEKLDVEDIYLQLLDEVIDLTKGDLDIFPHSILKILLHYIELNSFGVLRIIIKLLKAKSQTWLYSYTESIIIDILKKISSKHEIQDFKDQYEEISDLLSYKGLFNARELVNRLFQ